MHSNCYTLVVSPILGHTQIFGDLSIVSPSYSYWLMYIPVINGRIPNNKSRIIHLLDISLDIPVISKYIYIYVCILYIVYIYGTPKTYLSSKFSRIYSVFLNILNSKTWGIFRWSKIANVCKFVPIPPFPKYIGFKIQDLKKTSWIRRPSALNLESKEVGLNNFFLSLQSWILNPDRIILVTRNCNFLRIFLQMIGLSLRTFK